MRLVFHCFFYIFKASGTWCAFRAATNPGVRTFCGLIDLHKGDLEDVGKSSGSKAASLGLLAARLKAPEARVPTGARIRAMAHGGLVSKVIAGRGATRTGGRCRLLHRPPASRAPGAPSSAGYPACLNSSVAAHQFII